MSRVTSAGLLTELFERINCGNRVRFVIFYYLKLTATFAYRNKNINLEYLNVQKSFIIYISFTIIPIIQYTLYNTNVVVYISGVYIISTSSYIS